MAPKRVGAEDAGCWLDGHLGHYLCAETIRLAVLLGWENAEAEQAADEYFLTGGLDGDNSEYVYDSADSAVNWMNEEIAPEGFAFGFHEGELMLWSETEWEE